LGVVTQQKGSLCSWPLKVWALPISRASGRAEERAFLLSQMSINSSGSITGNVSGSPSIVSHFNPNFRRRNQS
jgi:hypothetical protein